VSCQNLRSSAYLYFHFDDWCYTLVLHPSQKYVTLAHYTQIKKKWLVYEHSSFVGHPFMEALVQLTTPQIYLYLKKCNILFTNLLLDKKKLVNFI